MKLFAASLMVLIAAEAFAQAPRPPQTTTMFLQAQYDTLKRNLTASADKIPAEHFSFRPTPDVRTVAEQFAHTIETQMFYCHAVKGGADPIGGRAFEKLFTGKAGVVQMVKDGFAYCDDAFAKLTDESLVSMVTMGTGANARQVARGSRLSMVVVHGNEHYGNLVTYMRMKGIVPPSSAQ